jgi:sugar lactone lactonase YvrE
MNRLFVLELSSGCVFSVDPGGADKQLLVLGCRHPDGIAVDVANGHLYWTNMGEPSAPDGSIERADLDGANRVTIVPAGATFTPKQLKLEPAARKLYWCDREGMRVMRCNLDGTGIETLVQTGEASDRGDQARWCVGIAVDVAAGHLFWSQKGPSKGGRGRILRAGLELPPGESAAARSDIEVLHDGLPEPIDLELDGGWLYWTDRGDPPRGNTVNRARRDGSGEPEILVTGLMEGIGLALDPAGGRMFVSDFGGSLYAADLGGGNRRELLEMQGNLAGIAYADVPFPAISQELLTPR